MSKQYWLYKDLSFGSVHFSPKKIEDRVDLQFLNHVIEYSAYEELKEEFKDFFMDFLNQGCGQWNEEKGYHEYDHMCLSTYEGGVERALEMGWIKKEQVLR